MRRSKLAVLACAALLGCGGPDVATVSHTAAAEGFFRGVFGCDPNAIDAYGSEDVVVSYPIFQALYGTSKIEGREAVKEFAANFCRKWGDPRITVEQSVEEEDRVVLVWSFSAVDGAAAATAPNAAPRESWGGISAFRMDEQGKVTEEVGEESAPGPVARLRSGGE